MSQSKQNIAQEKRVSKTISQQQEEEIKRYQQQQKSEYKFMKARLKRVSVSPVCSFLFLFWWI
jgi:hypothetical protein